MTEKMEFSVKDQAEHILRSLGLTNSQAKLYAALAIYHTSAIANTISSFTEIPRTETYRLLKELQDKGLVEETVLNPRRFKAIPLKEAVSILVETRRRKLDLLTKETENLLMRLPKEIETPQVQNSQEFVLIPRGKTLVNRIEKAIRASKHRILAITPWRVLTQWMLQSRGLWHETLKRGVEVCWITGNETPKIDYNMKIANGIPANSNFKLKATPDIMDIRMFMLDNVEVFMGTYQSQKLAGSTALWTNNSILVKALNEFFHSKWTQTKE